MKVEFKLYESVFLHVFKELIVDVISSGVDREWQRRRRFHSEDALGSLRLKNARSGYVSRITKLLASRRRITITLPLYLET